ncbi:MAG: hypothetical protein ACRDCI_05460, partial [Plesiomonas shigelloides]
EEMGDLDWLARNVHAWDGDFGFIAMLKMSNSYNLYMYTREGSKLHPYFVGSTLRHARPYSKAQWLSRRAELQNKPSWRDTLEKRPADLPEQAVTSRLKEATDNVLAAVPEMMTDKYKFEPFVSVEDAATAKQPAPKGSGNPILGMVLADMTNRALEGKEKYGEPLLAHNGRNPLWDLYQELLDAAMYIRQAIEEQKK